MRNVNLIVIAVILLASFGAHDVLAQCASGSGTAAGSDAVCGDGAEGCPLQAQAKVLANELHRGSWQGHIIDLDGNVLRIGVAIDRRLVSIVQKDGTVAATAKITGIGAGPSYITLQLTVGTGDDAKVVRMNLSWVKRDNGRQVLRGVLPGIGSVEGGVVIMWNTEATNSSATGSAGGCSAAGSDTAATGSCSPAGGCTAAGTDR